LKKETYKELDSRLKVSKEGHLEDIEEKNILESSNKASIQYIAPVQKQ